MLPPKTLPGERFCSFEQAFPSEHLVDKLVPDKWELHAYNTIYGNGTMLLCRGNSLPQPVKIRPGKNGWHRIYVCLVTERYPSAAVTFKLKGDCGSSPFCKNYPNPAVPHWSNPEMAEEYYWESADLTDEEITIEKLPDNSPSAIGVLWFRFEPMTEADVSAFKADASRRDVKRLHAHTDLDWLNRVDNVRPEMFDSFVHSMVNSDAELLSVEFYQLLMNVDFLKNYKPEEAERLFVKRTRRVPELIRQQKEIYTHLTQMCHERNLTVHAALRHSFSVNPFPFDYSYVNHVDFAKDHPEFYCVDRDGEVVTMFSYAYKETQDFVINAYLKMMDYGFDGVTMFCHRGVMTLFEQPVLDLCAKMYDGLDARKLAWDDERLMTVHCELITPFIRRLREALDAYSQAHGKKHLGITIIGCYTVQDNRRIGIDVGRWAEEGLIDNFVVGNMNCTEDDDRFMDEAHPGLIDIEKYKEAKYHDVVRPVHRNYAGGAETMIAGIPGLMDISRRTGLKVYFDVPWECTVEPEAFRDYALKLYEAGAENISLWDCYITRVMNRAEWNVVSRFGHVKELPATSTDRESYGRTVRVLSYDNMSIACFHPSWRG